MDPQIIPPPVGIVPPRPSPRSIVLALSGTVTALLVCVLTLAPLPYIVERPGPAFDLFAGDGENTLLSLTPVSTFDDLGELTTYDPSGELLLTTVAVSGGPGSSITIGGLIRDWLSPSATVFPERYSTGAGNGSIERQWITSQEVAILAALVHEGVPVPMVATLSEIDPDSNALGLLEEQDIIVAINGTEIETFNAMSTILDPLEPGDEVTVTVNRAGREETVSFPTIDNGAGEAIMGVWYDPVFSFPFEVTVNIDNVGGPSGGMVFALGIIDLLTPEDELKGESVAGTGTIGTDGSIGPIGGIDLKMRGAVLSGAQWFLAPEPNCPEVVGRVPDGLTVVAVSTLQEAYDAMVSIGEGRTGALPSCG